MITYFSTMAQVIPVFFLLAIAEFKYLASRKPPDKATHRYIRGTLLVVLGLLILTSTAAAEWTAMTATFVLGVEDKDPEALLNAANMCFFIVIGIVFLATIMVGVQTTVSAFSPPIPKRPAAPVSVPDKERPAGGPIVAVSLVALAGLVIGASLRRGSRW